LNRSEGSLSRLSQPWPRPNSVDLRPRSFSLHDARYFPSTEHQPLLEFELIFVMRKPNLPRLSGDQYVSPKPDLLERFLRLADATDPDIHQFALRFGALLAFSRRQKSDSKGHVVIAESCNVWRYFASSMGSILRIGAALHAEVPPNQRDWAVIAKCPTDVERAGAESVPEIDILGTSLHGEYGWSALAYYLRRQRTRNQEYWVRLLNSLLDLGRVRPWVVWDKDPPSTRPQLVFAGPNLLSYLVLQLCLRVSRLDSFVLCSYCNREYLPLRRAPKTGQRNFCPQCRKAGEPVRLAQRDLEARRREKKK
jgi:hypothetical protein